MTGRRQGRRRFGRAAAMVAAMVAAIATIATAMIGPASGAQAVSPAASPAGWTPVTYQGAQLSVPGSWLVESPQQLWCGPQADGLIFAGLKPGFPKNFDCGLTASLAWIRPAGPLPKGIRHRKPTAVLHGIPVYRQPSAKGSVLYLVPSLGVRVGARGLLAPRVLATLTRSPLSVVLRHGRAAPVPAGWTWRRFGGVRFAVPRSWSVQRENQWATCGTGLVPDSLLLADATKPPLPLPCPAQIPAASAEQAQPGLTVVTGKYAARSVGENYVGCRTRHGVRICLSSGTGQGGFLSAVLIFSVSRPHHASAYLLLGLFRSGASARAIFDSVRAA